MCYSTRRPFPARLVVPYVNKVKGKVVCELVVVLRPCSSVHTFDDLNADLGRDQSRLSTQVLLEL